MGNSLLTCSPSSCTVALEATTGGLRGGCGALETHPGFRGDLASGAAVGKPKLLVVPVGGPCLWICLWAHLRSEVQPPWANPCDGWLRTPLCDD